MIRSLVLKQESKQASLMSEYTLTEDARGLLEGARSAIGQGDHQNARHTVETVLATHPVNASVCRACGWLLLEMKDYSAAVAAFRKGVEAAPEDAEMHRSLGCGLGFAGDFCPGPQQEFGNAPSI